MITSALLIPCLVLAAHGLKGAITGAVVVGFVSFEGEMVFALALLGGSVALASDKGIFRFLSAEGLLFFAAFDARADAFDGANSTVAHAILLAGVDGLSALRIFVGFDANGECSGLFLLASSGLEGGQFLAFAEGGFFLLSAAFVGLFAFGFAARIEGAVSLFAGFFLLCELGFAGLDSFCITRAGFGGVEGVGHGQKGEGKADREKREAHGLISYVGVVRSKDVRSLRLCIVLHRKIIHRDVVRGKGVRALRGRSKHRHGYISTT